MKTYLIEESWSGYSRGGLALEVRAKTKEEAMKLYELGAAEEVERFVISDDTESDFVSIEEVKS